MASSSGVAGPYRGHHVEEGLLVDGPRHGWGGGLHRGHHVEGGSLVGSPRHGQGRGLCRGHHVEGGSSVGGPQHVWCVGRVRVIACGGRGYG